MPSSIISLVIASSFIYLAAATDSESTESAKICSAIYSECEFSIDCCDNTLRCLSSARDPMDPTGRYVCLPPAPKCYGKGKRCEGAPGQNYVPPAPCCDTSLQCRKAPDKGWGLFCVAPKTEQHSAEIAVDAHFPGTPAECIDMGFGCDDEDNRCCGNLFCNQIQGGDSVCQVHRPPACSKDGFPCDDWDHMCCGDSVCKGDAETKGRFCRATVQVAAVRLI